MSRFKIANLILVALFVVVAFALKGNDKKADDYDYDGGQSNLSSTINSNSNSYGIKNVSNITSDVDSMLKNSEIKGGVSSKYDSSTEVYAMVICDEEPLAERYMSSDETKTSTLAEYISNNSRYSDGLSDEQDDTFNNVSDYVTGGIVHNYSILLNGFAVKTTYENISIMKTLEGVRDVYVSEVYSTPSDEAEQVSANYNKKFASKDDLDIVENNVDVDTTGIYNSKDIAYDGTGTLMAILDTGLAYTHSAFQDAPGEVAFTKDMVKNLLSSTTASKISAADGNVLTADQLYKDDKVPFQYDYADHDPDVYPMADHGTHVAGIITGEDSVIRGVAPKAQLAIMKVFSNTTEGAQTIDIVAALEDCCILNVDAINMSLGSSAGFTDDRDTEGVDAVYNRVNELGISLLVAASNDASSSQGAPGGNTNLTSNPDSATIGSPSTFPASMAVASISGVKTPYILANGNTPVYFTEASATSGKKHYFIKELFASQFPSDPDKESASFEYVTIPGIGGGGDYAGIDVAGKIALVKRGSISFEEKIENAQGNLAIGVIIYNNVTGEIGMSVGNAESIPAASVQMDIGKVLAAKATGTFTFDNEQLAGPFMSGFSSWGVMPNMELKPDITAHGGDIYSAVRNGYDTYSGTSMATPNLAGATLLVRQYVKERFPNLSKVEVTELTYQLMMSTATIALNEDGNPYSPRKQGAGLADIAGSINTNAYLYVDGINKTKISLGDDKDKTGVYEMSFDLKNISNQALSFEISPTTFTESLSSDADRVAEKAFMLENTTYVITVDGAEYDSTTHFVNVEALSDAKVTVKVILTDEAKDYLNTNFENGMFVEGFVKFLSSDLNVNKDLNIPFCGFYGDWFTAPVLDITAYEVGASNADDSVLEEDKLQPDVYATIPMGGFTYDYGTDQEDEGFWGMGEMGYYLADGYEAPATEEKHASISTNMDAFNRLDAIYAGLLRGAKRTDMAIYNVATGEKVFETSTWNGRKSVNAMGGFIEVGFNAAENNLQNGQKYRFEMISYVASPDMGMTNGDYSDIDIEGNKANKHNTFSFTFEVDSEAPVLNPGQDMNTGEITDPSKMSNVRIERQTDGSFRYFLDLEVYDNHYLQLMTLGTYDTAFGNKVQGEEELFKYGVPLDSGYNRTNKVTFELTNYWKTIMDHDGNVSIEFTDWARNVSKFAIKLPTVDATNLKTVSTSRVKKYTLIDDKSVVFYENADGSISYLDSEGNKVVGDIEKCKFAGFAEVDADMSTLELDKNETYDLYDTFRTSDNGKLYSKILPGGAWISRFSYTSSDPSVAVATDGVIYAKDVTTEQTADITVTSPAGGSWTITVTVKPEGGRVPKVSSLDLGYTYKLVKQGDKFDLNVGVKPFFLSEENINNLEWSTTNDKIASIKVDENDPTHITVTGLDKGSATVSVKVKGTYYTSNVRIIVPNPFKVEGRMLTGYTGSGIDGVVTIPDDEGIYKISSHAFLFNEDIKKIIVPEGVEELDEAVIYGCDNLEEVILPSTMKTIYKFGLAYNPKLKNVEIGGTVSIYTLAFYNNSSLETVNLSGVYTIGENAFSNNTSLKSVDLSKCGDLDPSAFTNCSSLSSLTLSEQSSIGVSGFANSSSLKSLVVKSGNIKEGAFQNSGLESVVFENDVNNIELNAFNGCENLKSVVFKGDVRLIGESAFEGTTSLTSITLPNGLEELGANAFKDSGLETVNIAPRAMISSYGISPFAGCSITDWNVASSNPYFQVGDNNVVYDKGMTKLYFAPEKLTNIAFDLPSTVVEIAPYAFSNSNINSIDLSNVKVIGEGSFYGSGLSTVTFGTKLKEIPDYAFASCTVLTSLSLPEGIKVIGNSAFEGSTKDSSSNQLIVPSTVEVIGNQAFKNVPSMTKVTFQTGSKLVMIGNESFASNDKLASVTLPSGLLSIYSSAFKNNKSLVSVVVPSSVVNFGTGIFENNTKMTSVVSFPGINYIPEYTYKGCVSINTSTLPTNVVTIKAHAFENASGFGTTTYSSYKLKATTLVSIEDYAFANTNLSFVSLTNLTTIGSNAFKNNSYLSTVVLPNIVSIGDSAFENDSMIKRIVGAENLKTVGAKAFKNCSTLDTFTLSNVETFGEEAFRGSALTEVDLVNATSIERLAFEGTYLVKVQLYSSLVNLEDGAFVNTSLSSFEDIVSGSYFVEDGVLYHKNANGSYELEAYPEAKLGSDYTVLAGTSRVSYGVFKDSQNLNKIDLPMSLLNIADEAFNNSNITDYVFRSKIAPTLESYYIYGSKENETFYKNFGDINFASRSLSISAPANGSGYDEHVYTTYFSNAVIRDDLSYDYNGSIAMLALSKLSPDMESNSVEDVENFVELYNKAYEENKRLFSSELSDEQKDLISACLLLVEENGGSANE